MRQFVIALGDHLSATKIGPFLRRFGKALDTAGYRISQTSYLENYVRSLRNVPTENHIPDLKATSFVAPNCTVIGDVKFGKNSSIWYGAVARGDIQKIEVGENSVVQDLVTIKRHDGLNEPIIIGKNVFIGPGCKIGGCVLQDHSFISMGATVQDGCVVESYGFLAAGAVLTKGSRLPSGQIWAGSPAAFLREVTVEERDAIYEHQNEMNQLAVVHSQETEKSFDQVFIDDVVKEKKFHQTWTEQLAEKMESMGFAGHISDAFEHEFVKGNQRYQYNERWQSENYDHKSWRPFTEDAAVYPEDWKIYGEDMDRYDRAKKVFDSPAPQREGVVRADFPKDQSPWTKRY